MFRPRKYSFLTILLQIQPFWRWEGVLRSPVLLIIITQRLELPAFAFSFPLSSVSATGRHKVQELLLNTGCMKYPMERRNEKCLKNFRICKCKNFERLTNFRLKCINRTFFPWHSKSYLLYQVQGDVCCWYLGNRRNDNAKAPDSNNLFIYFILFHNISYKLWVAPLVTLLKGSYNEPIISETPSLV